MPENQKIRVILDTNLWISYLISKRLNKIDEHLERDDVVLLFSEESLEEFVDVVRRPKFRPYFPEEDVEELLDLFDKFGEIIEVISDVNECRDPKDNFLLALAKDGKADFLVTSDDDLLVIRKFQKTEILSYAEFAKTLR
jgi:putative toxin-antitoxin system toxin component, PIN family